MRSEKDSGQTERDKLKYLHYLNKVIEKKAKLMLLTGNFIKK